MCVLLHLLICTALRAHIIVVEALYKINYYNYYYLAITATAIKKLIWRGVETTNRNGFPRAVMASMTRVTSLL